MVTPVFDPHKLDIRRFAQYGAVLSGSAALAQFARLTEGVAADAVAQAEPIAWQATGAWQNVLGQRVQAAVGEVLGQPWLTLQLRGQAPCVCQRCMGLMWVAVEEERQFRFVPDEATASREDETSTEDVLVQSKQFDVLELIEDELLLALPLVPMHAQCPANAHALPTAPSSAAATAEKVQPFAQLGAMLKKNS